MPMVATYNTPMRRSRCFVFDNLCMNCQILTASKPKRTVTPFMYMCLARLYPLVGFQQALTLQR